VAVVAEAECMRIAVAFQENDRRTQRVLNFGPSNLELVWNLVLGIWDFDPPSPLGGALAVRLGANARSAFPPVHILYSSDHELNNGRETRQQFGSTISAEA
jgi:hypothetical protein